MLITMQHKGSLRYCNKGARLFAERHGLDWDTFRTIGIDETVLLATGDHMAVELVRVAHEMENK